MYSQRAVAGNWGHGQATIRQLLQEMGLFGEDLVKWVLLWANGIIHLLGTSFTPI